MPVNNVRLKAAAVILIFLAAGVLYSADRGQDLLFYGTENRETMETGETDTTPEAAGESAEGVAAISGTGQGSSGYEKTKAGSESKISEGSQSSQEPNSSDGSQAGQEPNGSERLQADPESIISGETGASGLSEQITMLHVHVCGAVKRAGVYLLKQDAIIEDAIRAAGGVTADGAGDYLNLADRVYDGEKIYVPFFKDLDHPYGVDPVTGQADSTGRTEAGLSGMQGSSGKMDADSESSLAAAGTGPLENKTAEQGKVNINTAGKEELMTLPGIGESRGEAILSYRQEYGGFSSIEDIMKVSGIKEGAFRKIKDSITV